MCVNKEILVKLLLFTYPALVHIVKHYLPEMRFYELMQSQSLPVSVLQGALSERPQMLLDQMRQSAEVMHSLCHVFCFHFNCTSFTLRLIFYVWFPRALHLFSRVWSLPTVPKLIAKKREEKEMKGKGDWQTGWNWPVCCVEDSFPVKRPSSDTSSSLSFTRYT